MTRNLLGLRKISSGARRHGCFVPSLTDPIYLWVLSLLIWFCFMIHTLIPVSISYVKNARVAMANGMGAKKIGPNALSIAITSRTQYLIRSGNTAT